MKELVDLIRTWRELPAGTPVVLATVVATSGSTYRRPGARMLLTPEGWAAGSISGGCLEGDLVQSAFARTSAGPALVTYDSTADEDILWGFGLGCNGVVQVLLQRLPDDGGVLAEIAAALESRTPLTLATVVTPGTHLGCYSVMSERTVIGNESVFHETIYPPRPLVIFGAGHDVIPLVTVAKSLGWHVTVSDPRPSYADRARFMAADEVLAMSAKKAITQMDTDERTAVVIMGHNYLNDLASLRAVVPSKAAYIGLLGPARRGQKLVDDLQREIGLLDAAELQRVHSPIGLDLGADGPDEIALAIVAEIQAFFNGRPGSFLTGRTEPLHEFSPPLSSDGETENPACHRLAS